MRKTVGFLICDMYNPYINYTKTIFTTVSFNRLPKDLKRTAGGFKNFDCIRNRILWIVRDNQPMLAVPKTLDEIHPKKDKQKGMRQTKR